MGIMPHFRIRYNSGVLIVGEARYTNGMLVLPSQLEWEEGAKVIVAKVDGGYVLIPAPNDVDINFLLLAPLAGDRLPLPNHGRDGGTG
jgi:hypothetical protein